VLKVAQQTQNNNMPRCQNDRRGRLRRTYCTFLLMLHVSADASEAGRQAGREAGREAGRQAGRQGGGQAARQRGREAGREGGGKRSGVVVVAAGLEVFG
jgi:hypothetical protein